MSAEPVNGWDSRVLAATEATYGTTPAPAAAQGLETISCNVGPGGEVGRTRPKQDRSIGRGHTDAFVEGRVDPIPFEIVTSIKSRADADDSPKELALYKAAGLLQTVNVGTNNAFTLQADPIGAAGGAALFPGLSLFRAFGPNTYRYLAEQIRGGIVRQIVFEGGDKELVGKFSGVAIAKTTQGEVSSITLADGVGTSLSLTAEQSYRVGPGYYQVESEIIKVDDTNAALGATTRSIARAQLSSSGAAHAAKVMYPYMVAPTYVGSPISEANVSGTIDSVAIRVLSFSLTFDTGGDLMPGETGSKYVQGVKFGRYKVMLSVKSVLHREEVSWLGKITARKAVAVSLVCGTGAGGIITFTLPQGELRPFITPDTANDVSVVDLGFEARDSSSGNDAFSFTLT